MINKYKINTGASVKDYNKVSDWLSFEIPNKINISSGKVDIGQHISTTLALICSRELGIDINSIFVNLTYLILITPGLYFIESPNLSRYWFFTLLILYMITYSRLYRLTKN